jgi:hypothetical protein
VLCRLVSSFFRLVFYLPSFSFLFPAYFRHVSKICRTVIISITQTQHLLFTLKTRRLVRKILKHILLVLSYISSTLSALSLPLYSIRVSFNSAFINAFKTLKLDSTPSYSSAWKPVYRANAETQESHR